MNEYDEPCDLEEELGTSTPGEAECSLSYAFSDDQAEKITYDIYQPLLELIRAQQKQIDDLKGQLMFMQNPHRYRF